MDRERETEIIKTIKEMGVFRTPYKRDIVSRVVSKAIKALEEQKTGHWIYDKENTVLANEFNEAYKCSCCGKFIVIPRRRKDHLYDVFPYCHCGAKMCEEEK